MESTYITTPDKITWYTTRFTTSTPTTANPIILIPSGEGDSGNLLALGTLLASSGYPVLTFDNPGFSRTTAPKEAYSTITPSLIATQIITLLDTLNIQRATFFGNSSGGGAVLAILALYPQRVRCAIVHEVPLQPFPLLLDLVEKTDDEISTWCASFFAANFIEQETNSGRAKWDALGPEYHERLRHNFPVWVRGLVAKEWDARTLELLTPEKLRAVPLFWTVGGLSRKEAWGKNFEVAGEAGIEVRTDVLECLHFPYVSIPEKLRDWVVECVEKTE